MATFSPPTAQAESAPPHARSVSVKTITADSDRSRKNYLLTIAITACVIVLGLVFLAVKQRHSAVDHGPQAASDDLINDRPATSRQNDDLADQDPPAADRSTPNDRPATGRQDDDLADQDPPAAADTADLSTPNERPATGRQNDDLADQDSGKTPHMVEDGGGEDGGKIALAAPPDRQAQMGTPSRARRDDSPPDEPIMVLDEDWIPGGHLRPAGDDITVQPADVGPLSLPEGGIDPPQPPPVEPPEMQPPALTEAEVKALVAALDEVKSFLADRRLDDARESMKRAEAMVAKGGEDEYSERVDRMALLCEYVHEFWDAVRQGMPGVEGKDLMIGKTLIHVTEANAQGILLKSRGKRYKYSFFKMPAQMVVVIAEQWLADIPDSQIFVGAFMAVDPKYGLAEARQQWQLAQQGGAPVDELMPILDELGEE